MPKPCSFSYGKTKQVTWRPALLQLPAPPFLHRTFHCGNVCEWAAWFSNSANGLDLPKKKKRKEKKKKSKKLGDPILCRWCIVMCVVCLLEVCCRDLCAAHPWLWFVRWDSLHWPNRSARCNAASQQLYHLPDAQPVPGPQTLPLISVWLPAWAWF